MGLPDFRPEFHYTAASTWLNDPNGLIHHNGRWHLFYQANPLESQWGHMSWGHATSKDLLHWKERDVALRFTDEIEMFSGSCVYDRTNTSGLGTGADGPMVAVYTMNHTDASAHPRRQAQGLAFSNDEGRTWQQYAKNPVCDRESTDFRDPKVFWYGPGGYWVMVTVEALDNVVWLYASDNLIDWRELSSFGPTGARASTWECPDLFPLTVEGTEETAWVLVVSLNPGALYGGSGVQYFIGDFDGTTFTSPDLNSVDPRQYNWLDFGQDYYAPVSFNDAPDGRRIMIGWMSNWEYARETPTEPWRGAMSIPREMSLVRMDGRLRVRQRPVHELTDQWSRDVMLSNEDVRGERRLAMDVESGVFNIVLRPGADECGLRLSGTRIGYKDGRLFLDRSQSGHADFHPDFAALQWADVPLVDGALSITVVHDRCSLEVFAQGGLYTITSLLFAPDDPDVFVYADGHVHVDQVTLLDLPSPGPHPRL